MPAPQSRFKSWLSPWMLIWFSIQLHFGVFTSSLRTHGLSTFLRISEIREQAQAQMLSETSEGFVKYENTTAVPSLVKAASGKILELGPGPGNQIARYDPDRVECIYGVDPNPGYGPEIDKKLQGHPLRNRYEFIPCGLEDSDVLRKHGVTEGSMDTVISIQVMCAVGDVKLLMKEVYKLLKPGGKFIFWEHQTSTDPLTAAGQAFWQPLWSTFVGCQMYRNVMDGVLAAGEWANPEEVEKDDDPTSYLPRTWGVLVKKA